MERRLFSLLLLGALLAGGTVCAGPVSPERAARVAGNFWHNALGMKRGGELVDRTAEWEFGSIYLFTHPQGGFVMVAADDGARPILGYSPSGTIDPQALPAGLRDWLGMYQAQLDFVREHKCAPYRADNDEWQMLECGIAQKGPQEEGVGPLLVTNWDQTAPYNELCPANTVTGCAATAQAQLMKYWNYPAFGSGQHGYTCRGYGVQEADFGHTLYDWDHMPARALVTSTDAERRAVATLMYHCGVALEMEYHGAGEGGSSAVGLAEGDYQSINNSLVKYFRYSPDMYVATKDYGYTNESWRRLLISELDKGHPMVYTGSATQGGHGFVCDGYDSRQYLHFNFGWSGLGDGYYPVDSISPGVGGAGGNVTYTFNLYNQVLIGAVPRHDLAVSDTLFSFYAEGGQDSLLFAVSDSLGTGVQWDVRCSEPWVHLDYESFGRAGWIRLTVDENAEGRGRNAEVVFSQGGLTQCVHVAQVAFSSGDLCPLTIVMESTNGAGWQGEAYLSVEDETGYLFGTARLDYGRKDSVVVYAGPHNVRSVWHSGGGTDRYINYYVKNRYGETLVDGHYAYRNGGTHLIEWPCAHLAVDEAEGLPVSVYPNPTAGMLHIEADGLRQVELMDVSGRVLHRGHEENIDMGRMGKGVYFVRVTTDSGTAVRRVQKY